MRILLTNDDGIDAPGLAALVRRARVLGTVTVVAPAGERSGTAHAVTLSGSLPCKCLSTGDGVTRYAFEGTPVDCVKFAVSALEGARPDLVLSGINRGANVGVSVLYSGTVSAALEAAMYGLPAASISLAVEEGGDEPAFDRAADIALGLIEHLLREGAFDGAPLNINIPPLRDGWPVGWRAVPQSTAVYRDRFVVMPETNAWTLVSGETRRETDPDTDLRHLLRGYVTVTPLSFDLTHREALDRLRRVAEGVAEEA